MELMSLSRLKFEGEFDERVRRAIGHLNELNTDEMRMEFTHPTERWHWGADYMSRWLGAMTLLSDYTGEDYGVDGVARELVDFQEADGSFGPFTNPHDEQEWFGMGRGLVGLLEYYQVRRDPAALESARRLGDYYVEHYPPEEEITELCECYPSGLDGIVLLAHLTGEEKYLSLARTIAERSSVNQRRYYSTTVNEQGYRKPLVGHTHCQLLTAKGMIDLNNLFGDARFMPAVLDLHKYFLEDLMWISGGIPEFLQIPHLNETCSDVDWLRLNLQLWKTTGEQVYFEIAENILLNQLYFDQEEKGGFCFWRGLQGHMGATFDACCSHHGARALAEAMRYVYTFEPGVLQANLFLEGAARIDLDGSELAITCTVDYGNDTMVISYALDSPPPTPFTYRLRVPEWAGSARLLVNTQDTASSVRPGYVEAKRTWSSGDRIELRLPMKVRVVRGRRHGQYVLDPNEVAVFYGPRLFCFVDIKNLAVVPPLVTLDLSEDIRPVEPSRLTAWATTVTGERVQIVLTPLADVGGRPNGIGRIHAVRTPHFNVWLPAANAH